MSKKESNEKGLDLKQVVKDAYDEPSIDEGRAAMLNPPQKIKLMETDEVIEDVSALYAKVKGLTFQKAIVNALQHNPPPQQDKDFPSVERRSFLALRLVADTDVSLTSTEVDMVCKCAKVYYGQPGKDSIIYARIVQLLDPEEARRKLGQ